MSRINEKSNAKLLLLVLIIICLLIFAFLFYNFLKPQTVATPLVTSQVSAVSTSDVIPNPVKTTTSQISPDGLFELTLITNTVEPEQIEYKLLVKEIKTGNEKLIFTQTVGNKTAISIPFNTWSADNKHFFITQYYMGTQKNLVFKTSGEKFAEDPFLDVNNLYIEKEIAYDFNEATGWASQNLLVIKTQKTDGTGAGPSYWFDIVGKTFIQLSTQF